jgi:hypothetical protein
MRGATLLQKERTVKGISPVVSVLLMVVIVVAASLIAYMAFMGYLSFQTKQIGKAILVQSVAQDSESHLIVYVQNVGQGTVHFNPLSCLYVDRNLENCAIQPNDGSLAEGEIAILISEKPVVTSTPVKIRVVVTDGAFAEAETPVVNPPIGLVVIINSDPPGSGYVKVDGMDIDTPQTFVWDEGSIHRLEALSLSTPEARRTWISWSDGETQIHDYRALNSLANITAKFETEYYLTVRDGGHGTTTGEGWYEGGTNATFSITPRIVPNQTGTQYVFTSWSGSGSGCYSGPLMSSSVIMNSPITETGNWKTQYYLKVDSPQGTPDGTGWYDAGSTVAFSVSPAIVSGGTGVQSLFTRWSGDGMGSYSGSLRSFSITLNNPVNETAVWKKQYYLTVNSLHGTVGGGGWYDENTNAQATVTPLIVAGSTGTRYLFLRWSADASGTASPSNNILMDKPKTATAIWKTQFRVSFAVSSPGWGNTNPPPGTSNWYDSGTSGVAISATANSGYRFTSWSAPASIAIVNSSASSTTAAINGPGTITAYFVIATQTVRITSSPFTGSGFLLVDGSLRTTPFTAVWTVGSSHTIEAASPVAHGTGTQLVWNSWSDGGARTHTYTVPSSDDNITANYRTQYYLAVSSAHDSPTPQSNWFDSGTRITASIITPADQSGSSRFRCTGWTGTGSVPTSGSGTSTTFTINSASSITWNWVAQCQVTFGVAPSGGGTTSPTGIGWYDVGTSVPISAIPSPHFNFISWNSSGSISILNPNSASTTATLNGPGSVTANFKIPTAMDWAVYPADITLGEPENLTGYLHELGSWLAGVNGKPVTFVFIAPSGSQFTVTVNTARFIFDGAFQTSFTPSSTGMWSVYVQFNGDATYAASRTSTETFFVASAVRTTSKSATGPSSTFLESLEKSLSFIPTARISPTRMKTAVNSITAVQTNNLLGLTGLLLMKRKHVVAP